MTRPTLALIVIMPRFFPVRVVGELPGHRARAYKVEALPDLPSFLLILRLPLPLPLPASALGLPQQ